MPAFFSWQFETVLFFLAEKEKNGFKKAFLWVRWEIGGCNDVLQLLPDPHPSASQTPSPEGKAIRCGGDLGGQGRPPLQKRRGGNIAGVSERREQSVALFRVVGMDGTDG